MSVINIRWLVLCAVVSAVAAMEVQFEDEIINPVQELSREKRQSIGVGGFQFPTPVQGGGQGRVPFQSFNPQSFQNPQNFQNQQSFQNPQNFQNFQGPQTFPTQQQHFQNPQSFQNPQNFQNPQSFQNSQFFPGAQNIQGQQNFQQPQTFQPQNHFQPQTSFPSNFGSRPPAFDFTTPQTFDIGAPSRPNCQGRRRRRPECQNQNKQPNCSGRRRRRPECQRQQGVDGAVAEAFNQVQWFNQLAAPNKSALQIPNLPGTPNKGSESRFFSLGNGPDTPFQQCVTPKFESGHCRYLQHCILPEFANNFFTFLNYVCFINGVYIGACCPDSRYPDQTTSTTTSTTTTTTPRPTTPASARGCGLNAKDGKRIVGGQKADPQEWPWMAALLRDGSDQYCGGVLITNAHILTAAHCVQPFTASAITIRLGEYTFDQTQDSSHRDFRVGSIQMHKNYNTNTYENDIAIISLQGSVETFNDFIWPVCLPPADNNKYVDEKATVTGWGTIYYGGPISSTLQEVTLPVWTNKECDSAYDEQDIVDNFLCAGIRAGKKDSCQGDSGGPLQWQGSNGRWAVIGVVSWGIRCAEPNQPGVYTRVNNYIDWIRENAI